MTDAVGDAVRVLTTFSHDGFLKIRRSPWGWQVTWHYTRTKVEYANGASLDAALQAATRLLLAHMTKVPRSADWAIDDRKTPL